MYNDKKSNFEELLERYGFVFIHHQMKYLKVLKGIDPQIVKEVFQFSDTVPYQIRTQTHFQTPYVHSVFSGTESIKFLVRKTWETMPHEIKQLESLKKFK